MEKWNMKVFISTLFFFVQLIIISIEIHPQETVTDYDGNVYETVTIGEQVWIKENLKSLHYSDGTEIPEVVAYNNDDSLAEIYGRLYTWDAAMRDSTQPGVQGVCPCEWHIPTDQEWSQLENYLGGATIAGGKMKDTGTTFWNAPNTGATNISGFTGLPAGEFDAYYNPNKFWLLHLAAVFWTSTQTNQSQALERYLSHDNSASGRLAWYKVMKYSIRCIKDSPTDIKNESIKINDYQLNQNYPNPFNPTTIIQFETTHKTFISLKVFNVLGNEIATLINEEKPVGSYSCEWNAGGFPSGVYFYSLTTSDFRETKKMILMK
jgi:uncharacterized protein (TIGR02145 family)